MRVSLTQSTPGKPSTPGKRTVRPQPNGMHALPMRKILWALDCPERAVAGPAKARRKTHKKGGLLHVHKE